MSKSDVVVSFRIVVVENDDGEIVYHLHIPKKEGSNELYMFATYESLEEAINSIPSEFYDMFDNEGFEGYNNCLVKYKRK